jgi:hypothetical protein
MLNVLSNAECAQVACDDIRTRFCFSSRTDTCAVNCLRVDNGVPEQCRSFPATAALLTCARYTPDAVDGIDNVVWLADSSLLDPIMEVGAQRAHVHNCYVLLLCGVASICNVWSSACARSCPCWGAQQGPAKHFVE